MKTSREHFKTGLSHYRAGDLEASIPEYQAALRLNTDFEEAHQNLGIVYSALGRTEDAAAEYREALRVNPYNANCITTSV